APRSLQEPSGGAVLAEPDAHRQLCVDRRPFEPDGRVPLAVGPPLVRPGLRGTPMIVSGFSGNEIYCLAQKGWTPGSIVVGNSVQSLGFAGGIASSLRTI